MPIARAFTGDGLNEAKASFSRRLSRMRAGDLSWKNLRSRMSRLNVREERIAACVSLCLMLAIAGCSTYWLMRMAQVLFPVNVSPKGVVFYEAASGQTVRVLFGEKGFDPSRLVLRGVVITGSEAGVNQGMALIEVDGKPAEAISLGEMVPPGIRLEKIQPDGAIVSYQGRDISLQQ